MTRAELQERAAAAGQGLSESERAELGMLLMDSSLPPLTKEQQELIAARMATKGDPTQWLSQEDFEARLEERLSSRA